MLKVWDGDPMLRPMGLGGAGGSGWTTTTYTPGNGGGGRSPIMVDPGPPIPNMPMIDLTGLPTPMLDTGMLAYQQQLQAGIAECVKVREEYIRLCRAQEAKAGDIANEYRAKVDEQSHLNAMLRSDVHDKRVRERFERRHDIRGRLMWVHLGWLGAWLIATPVGLVVLSYAWKAAVYAIAN